MSPLRKIREISQKVAKLYRNSRHFKVAANSSGVFVTLAPVILHLVDAVLSSSPDRDRPDSGSLVTKLGEYRCEDLEGTRICLNTDSEVRYRFNVATRNFEILHGEASFVVRKDRRPLDVLAGRVLVHDISTGFEIYRKRDSTQVTVTEGRVRVVAPLDTDSRLKFEHGEPENAWKGAPELRKFQQAEFDEASGTLRRAPELNERDVLRLLAWEEGRIDLNGRTISETIQELARYQNIPTFKYSSAAVGGTLLAGDVAFKDLDGFLVTLEIQSHIHHATSGTGTDATITLTPQSGKDRRK